jgi:hypothetical protein
MRLRGEIAWRIIFQDDAEKAIFPSHPDRTNSRTSWKLIADRKNCSEEEAAEFLKSLRKRQRSNATDQELKRSE